MMFSEMRPAILTQASSSSSLFPRDCTINLFSVSIRRRIRSRRHRLRLHAHPRSAVEEDEEPQAKLQFDKAKAREALQKLDQQLQSLEQQQTQLPKTPRPSSPYSEPNSDRDVITRLNAEEMPELSGSYLSYTAVALLLLTIFNNIIFNVIIKPSVDGYEQASTIEMVPLKEP